MKNWRSIRFLVREQSFSGRDEEMCSVKPPRPAYSFGNNANLEVIVMIFLLVAVVGLLFILTRIAHFFHQNKAVFPKSSYRRWQRTYRLFMIICFATLGYVLISIQLLGSLR